MSLHHAGRRVALLSALAALLSAHPAAATPGLLGPTYPPPGGVTFAGVSGGSGLSGGRTNSYSGFNPSAYGSLYFGADDTQNIVESFDGSNSEVLTFNPGSSNLAGGKLVWIGATTVYTTGGIYSNVATRFTLSLTTPGGTPLALTPAATVGLPSNVGGVLPVTGGYYSNLLFEAINPSTGTYAPADTAFNAYSGRIGTSATGTPELKSFTGGFYYTAPPVAGAPEPSEWAALGFTGLGVGGLLWRARKRRDNAT